MSNTSICTNTKSGKEFYFTNIAQLAKFLRVLYVKLSNRVCEFYTEPATSLRQAANMTSSWFLVECFVHFFLNSKAWLRRS